MAGELAHEMEQPPTQSLVEQLTIEAARFRQAKTLIDRKTYAECVDRLLDEWNEGQTIEFDKIDQTSGWSE